MPPSYIETMFSSRRNGHDPFLLAPDARLPYGQVLSPHALIEEADPRGRRPILERLDVVDHVEKLVAPRAVIDDVKEGESLLAAVDALKPRLVRAHPSILDGRRSTVNRWRSVFGLRRRPDAGEEKSCATGSDPLGWVSQLPGEPVLLPSVAGFARRDDVSFGGPPAADERDDVIHGERLRCKPATAVVAGPLCSLTLPPLAASELPGSGTLVSDVLVIGARYEGVGWIPHAVEAIGDSSGGEGP